MKTIIFKPVLLLVMILGVAFVSINAGQTVEDGIVKIEVAPGFTIEDIIQDLHDNSIVVYVSPNQGTSSYTLRYSSKIVDNTHIEQYLELHPGAILIEER
jgi:hypothetical protein